MTISPPLKALTIAGSDASGGAGLEADLKTFQELGVYGMAAVTCIVSENPQAEWRHDVFPVDLSVVEAQMSTILDGIGVQAAKTGMLGSYDLISLVVKTIKRNNTPNLVVDPVMACKGASTPLNPEIADSLRDDIMPLSTVITPNLYEAGIMSGLGEITSVAGMEEAAKALCKAGARTVLVKGGSKLAGATSAIDVVCIDGAVTRLETELVPDAYTHGAGCTISAAICANLAKGMPVMEAITEAKKFELYAIKGSFRLNRWVGPLRHDAWRRM